jgi:hypothetical protein
MNMAKRRVVCSLSTQPDPRTQAMEVSVFSKHRSLGLLGLAATVYRDVMDFVIPWGEPL